MDKLDILLLSIMIGGFLLAILLKMGHTLKRFLNAFKPVARKQSIFDDDVKVCPECCLHILNGQCECTLTEK